MLQTSLVDINVPPELHEMSRVGQLMQLNDKNQECFIPDHHLQRGSASHQNCISNVWTK